MKPNLDQLQFITSAPTRRNPALYSEPPESAVKEKPTIVIGPNAAYIVDPAYWPGKIEGEGTPPPTGEAQAPILSSIDPGVLPVWAADTEVFFNGSNFTESSVIIWNDGEEATKFVSPTQLSTIVKPSTVQAPLPFTLEAYVVDNGKASSKLAFTFIT